MDFETKSTPYQIFSFYIHNYRPVVFVKIFMSVLTCFIRKLIKSGRLD